MISVRFSVDQVAVWLEEANGFRRARWVHWPDAEALAAAGVPVEQLKAGGHFHSSFTMVDVVITGVSGRARMAEALRRFAGLPLDARDTLPPEVDVAAE